MACPANPSIIEVTVPYIISQYRFVHFLKLSESYREPTVDGTPLVSFHHMYDLFNFINSLENQFEWDLKPKQRAKLKGAGWRARLRSER